MRVIAKHPLVFHGPVTRQLGSGFFFLCVLFLEVVEGGWERKGMGFCDVIW